MRKLPINGIPSELGSGSHAFAFFTAHPPPFLRSQVKGSYPEIDSLKMGKFTSKHPVHFHGLSNLCFAHPSTLCFPNVVRVPRNQPVCSESDMHANRSFWRNLFVFIFVLLLLLPLFFALWWKKRGMNCGELYSNAFRIRERASTHTHIHAFTHIQSTID